ncbi:transcriptional regulator MerD [Photobacterium frigidiphilum]|uniref:Transcriptional regulator MerD n=1 Tax=Photobacterium frigidiphilum TaxID=264736 RepID=A0A2T3J754_9GAMM|nr:MerR family transcriptional regulator [Photobacterium frigidiphilum]PSU44555.1 transcriptional regulator MerD [Photobacterium frigidiphilum]
MTISMIKLPLATSVEGRYPMTISTLAKAADASIHTVRNYMAEGLIVACSRTQGGYWLFDEPALNRLILIRTAMVAGLRLQDIKPLLAALDPQDRRKINREKVLIDAQIAQNHQQLTQLSQLLEHI